MAVPPNRAGRIGNGTPISRPMILAPSAAARSPPMPDSALCEICRKVFDAIAQYPRWPSGQVIPLPPNMVAFPTRNIALPADNATVYVDFHNIQSLLCSAAEGCHLCALLVANLRAQDVTELLDELIESYAVAWEQMKVLVWRCDAALILDLQKAKPEPGVGNARTLIHLDYLAADTLLKRNVLFANLSNSTASFETFNKIHYWLWECSNMHPGCIDRLQMQQKELPTRLIYVGKFKSESIIQLLESTMLSTDTLDTRYITLSHCWGAEGSFKLTKDHYNEFLAGIQLESLPRTFRDAITLTRYLGVNYIWIDSLCIIQDSVDDWKSESFQMAAVYKGSFLNIGANAYYGSNGGLFHDRNPQSVMPVQMNLRWPPGHTTSQLLAFSPRAQDGDASEDGPLPKRGWVAQERLLAPRTLTFLSNKTTWQCSSKRAHEGDHLEYFKIETRHRPETWIQTPDEQLSAEQLKQDCFRKWNDAIEIYSKGDLTFQSDKLVAIAGLASHLQPLWKDPDIRYLAGLWSTYLEVGLLWQLRPGSERGKADQRAPSWSWASVRGELLCPRLGSRKEIILQARIVQVDTYPIDHQLGPVDGGYIGISAPLCPVRFTKFGKRGANSEAIFPSGRKITRFFNLSFDRGKPTLREGGTSENFFLLGVLIKPGEQSLLEGLIVELTGASNGQYTRVGQWSVLHTEMGIEKEKKLHRYLGSTLPERTEPLPNHITIVQEEFSSMRLPEVAYVTKDVLRACYTIVIL